VEIEPDLPKRQSRELAETYAEKLTLRKSNFVRANQLNQKARTKLAKIFAEKCSRF
jgi:ribosomal protein S17E